MPAEKQTARAKAAADARRRRDRARRRKTRSIKRFVRSTEPRVLPEEVQFRPMRTGRARGMKRIGWHILHQGKQAGRVSILYCEDYGQVAKASIDVQLNRKSRGRGIGTVAFQRASELSGFPEIFASIAKGNIASRKAAMRAGFFSDPQDPTGEFNLIWRRAQL